MGIESLEMLDPMKMNPPMNPTLVVDGAGLDKVKSFLGRVKEFGPDFETNIADFYQDRTARTFQVGDRNEQYVIDLLAFADGNTDRLIKGQGNFGEVSDPCLRPVIDAIREPLESNSHLKVGQNLAFEYTTLWWNLGIRMWNLYSVDVAEKLLLLGLVNPFATGYFAMDDLVVKYMGKRIDKTLQKSFDLESPLTPEQIMYAALDTRLPLGIRNGQRPKIETAKLEWAVQIRQDALGSYEDLHMNGFFLNRDAWMDLVNKAREEHRHNIEVLDTFFIPLVGRKGQIEVDLDAFELEWKNSPNKTPEDKALRAEKRKAFVAARQKLSKNTKNLDTYEGEAAINYGSQPQLLEALRKIKGLNKTTLPSTDDQVLKKLSATKNFPVVDAIREYRTSGKKLSTYGEEFLNWINKSTNRIHSKINMIGAATGRSSSVKPNIQNLPKEPEVRACFQARPGYKIVTVDMNGAELRIIAELALAKSWIEWFNKGWDLHSCGAELLFPVEWPQEALPGCAYYAPDGEGGYKHQKCKCPAHQERRNGNKSTNFLLAYGGGPRKLGEEIGKSMDEAIVLMNRHRDVNREVWDYLDRSGKSATLTMEARTMSGMRRRFKRPEYDDAARYCLEDCKEGTYPTPEQIRKKMRSMFGAIEREGKNTPIQGTNKDIADVAMGCGFDQDGKPFLWHILWPKYKAYFVNFVHDEFVVEAPEEVAEEVKHVVGDAFRRAGALFFKHITMEYDGHVADHWMK